MLLLQPATVEIFEIYKYSTILDKIIRNKKKLTFITLLTRVSGISFKTTTDGVVIDCLA